jgi:hypothetical protein
VIYLNTVVSFDEDRRKTMIDREREAARSIAQWCRSLQKSGRFLFTAETPPAIGPHGSKRCGEAGWGG